eukprot:4190192-Alexandrium_andersonii.AAC.2
MTDRMNATSVDCLARLMRSKTGFCKASMSQPLANGSSDEGGGRSTGRSAGPVAGASGIGVSSMRRSLACRSSGRSEAASCAAGVSGAG